MRHKWPPVGSLRRPSTYQVDALLRAGLDAENNHTDHASAKASRSQFDERSPYHRVRAPQHTHPGCEFVGCTGEHGGLRSLLWRCCRRGSASAATSRAPEPKTPTNARTFLVRSSPDLIATSANRRRPSMSRARCAATGRILAGDLAQAAHSGDGFPDPVRRWLTASGWTVPSELRCPDHA